MKKFKKIFVWIYEFLTSQRIGRYLFTIALCFAILLGFGVLDREMWGNLVSIFFGFIISSLMVGLVNVMLGNFEDKVKVTDDTEKLLKMYDDVDLTVTLGETKMKVAHKITFINDGKTQFDLKDDPNARYEPEDYIMENFDTLFNAHKRSAKKNLDTVRLKDFTVENGVATFYTMRSNYFYHLITNRAFDYRLADDLSLRSFYDYGPNVVPISESKMSNHIGINALVYLDDGELLLPRRKSSATISKNQVTSSIAMMLNIPKSGEITKEYLLEGCIKEGLISRTRMNPAWLTEKDISITFLGFGQNVYEGGKPQLYYTVKVNGLKREEYLSYVISQNKKEERSIIDQDKYVYVVDTSSMRFKNDDDLSFTTIDAKLKKGKYVEKRKKVVADYEQSFICNIWYEHNKQV